MLDVTRNLDALGSQLCGLAHRGGDHIDTLGQTLDHTLGDGDGVLRGRGHAAKEDMVPGIVVKRRDLEARRQRGTELRERLGQTQEDQPLTAMRPSLLPA